MKTIFSKVLTPLAIIAALLTAPIIARAQFADQATYAGTAGGTANAITLAIDNWNVNRAGVPLRFIPSAVNTGATTVIVNGVGSPIAIKKPTGGVLLPLSGGEISPSRIASITYDGIQFELDTSPANPPAPQGYLTPCQTSSPSPVSGCTVGQYFPTGDVTSATTLYFEGMNGGYQVPIFNGGFFASTPLTESQMTLILSGTANTANNAYDVCVYLNAGVPAIGTMPAWSNIGPTSPARSAAITQINGVWVNNATATVTNNNVGVSVAANQCTVVASILMDAVNGQVSFLRLPGQSRKWSISNIYNAQTVNMTVVDPTPSPWTYNSATVRASNGSTTNKATFLYSIPNDSPRITGNQRITSAAGSNGNSLCETGVGWNVTNAFSGKVGYTEISVGGGPAVDANGNSISEYIPAPFYGIGVATSVEASIITGAASCTYFGQANGMIFNIAIKG